MEKLKGKRIITIVDKDNKKTNQTNTKSLQKQNKTTTTKIVLSC